ncbi:TOPRIM nucleotidyl transferase/hydrolase domain-containing protein [Micromonospora kangleipakensis]|uniref:TOPRIM nucleotidyl transferase/hydrolase domain-containing protein n=1 Tax=Micromonospora kangleipakensis TaxID=1077942 RepID=UPI001F5EF4AA|nr:TOPRIM nucleotidyl transferase/hydrolase domain-containing protein [Micromonospora kangleipakensis]
MDLRTSLHRAAGLRARTVVLVEGTSDRHALEAVARRGGRSLAGVAIVPMGGITNIGHFLDLFGPRGLGRDLAGLYDVAEEGFVRPLAAQLHRFIGTRSGRKARYADLLAGALPPARVPPALDRLLARL